MENGPLLVIVPAFNEESTVGSVVREAAEQLGAEVLVVDDGSSDATGRAALQAGATVLTHPFNVGVGGAIRTGLRYALENGYQRVVQIDADGQHDPEQARVLLEALAGGKDLVIGSRFNHGYDTGRSRRLAMKVLSAIVSRRLGARITDTTSGFRAMGPRAVALFAASYPADYLNDTVEALLLAVDAGLSVGEVDVKMQERTAGKPSSSKIRSSYHFGRLLLVLLLGRVRSRPAS